MGSPSLRLSGADGLRGLACLAVLVSHAIGLTDPELAIYTRGLGRIGVWLFFCLSAFLLTMQLLHRGLGRVTLADYLIGRVLRIYPLYVVAVLAHFWTGYGEIRTLSDVTAALTLRAGFDHFWTIPVEFLFYLLLPPILMALLTLEQQWGKSAATGAVVLATLALQMWWPYWAPRPPHGEHLMWFLPLFLFATLAAILPRHSFAWAARAALFAFLASLALVPNPAVLRTAFGLDLPAWMAQKHLFFGLTFSVMLWAIVGNNLRVTRLLDARPLALVGRWSYSTYLFHMLVMQGLAATLPASLPGRSTLLVGAAIIFGAAVFEIAERPLFATRRALSRHMALWLDTSSAAKARSKINVS